MKKQDYLEMKKNVLYFCW